MNRLAALIKIGALIAGLALLLLGVHGFQVHEFTLPQVYTAVILALGTSLLTAASQINPYKQPEEEASS